MRLQPGAQGGPLPVVADQAPTPQPQGLFDKMASTVISWADPFSFRTQDGEGRFIGPFNPALPHPELAQSFLELQFAEGEHSVLAGPRSARPRDPGSHLPDGLPAPQRLRDSRPHSGPRR